jgi:UDP-N-acetylmuramoyl-tripeptide--D-alanyl-D-alanine ligase
VEERPLSFFAQACQAELVGAQPGIVARRICTDSRSVQAGDLFVAISGDRFDGHGYVAQALAQGAVGAVVERRALGQLPGLAAANLLVVENSRQALGLMAAQYRREFELPVVAVCGSNGKTTTKELLASVLRQRWAVLWSEASFNNEIGVPVTLLKMERTHGAAVLEAGTNHPGELAPLLRMIQPRYGILTSIGREHLEFFGDLDGVTREEGWVGEVLPADGALFIHGDSEGVEAVLRRTRAAVTRIGFNANNDWCAKVLKMDAAGVVFHVAAPDPIWSGVYFVPLPGRHQATNATLVIATAALLGLTREQIQRGLTACPAPKMRMQIREWNGVRILDDAYNANADSMLAALHTLRDMECSGRRVAVLGDMAELGSHSKAAHAEIGRVAGECRLDALIAVGQWAGLVTAEAGRAGVGTTMALQTAEEAGAAAKEYARRGDLVLFKASRALRMERASAFLNSNGGVDGH